MREFGVKQRKVVFSLSNILYQCLGKKISKNTLNKKGIYIIQKDKEGNYIQEFCSAAQAERITGVKRDNICMVLKGRTKTAGGFVWEYK